jgi:hypothetical protein
MGDPVDDKACVQAAINVTTASWGGDVTVGVGN